jgi:hypothetical protein
MRPAKRLAGQELDRRRSAHAVRSSSSLVAARGLASIVFRPGISSRERLCGRAERCRR